MAELNYDLIRKAVTETALNTEIQVADLINELTLGTDETGSPLTSARLLAIQSKLQQCATEMNLSATLVKKFSDMIDGIVQKIA